MARNVNMQRRHFEFIAATLRDIRNEAVFSDTSGKNSLDMVVREFSRALCATNSNFDVNRFERACGLIFSSLTLTRETRND